MIFLISYFDISYFEYYISNIIFQICYFKYDISQIKFEISSFEQKQDHTMQHRIKSGVIRKQGQIQSK